LLEELFGEILIPAAVHEEFLAVESGSRRFELEPREGLRIVPLTEPRRVLAFTGLDRGEAEVLALAEERKARLLLIDEKKARRYARRLGFSVTGTLGVLLLAKQEGLLKSVREAVHKLETAGLHLHDSLIARVLGLAGE
jgi:predicted nucleic acid-binding protein